MIVYNCDTEYNTDQFW